MDQYESSDAWPDDEYFESQWFGKLLRHGSIRMRGSYAAARCRRLNLVFVFGDGNLICAEWWLQTTSLARKHNASYSGFGKRMGNV